MEVAAHDTYVNAINSKLETLMSVLTDDVVYPSPGKPDIAGEVAARACAAANFASTRTHGTKTSVGFTHDTGKRLSVFHRGSDGRWCAAVDGWSSDRATGP